jgi:hypothetical protein
MPWASRFEPPRGEVTPELSANRKYPVFHPSRGLLATNLPLFPRRLQLPIPLGLNLLLMCSFALR